MRHRAFDPKLMVWLQPDPLGDVDGPNPYAYVGWDPFNRIDPYGLAWYEPSTWGDGDWHDMMDRNRGLQQGKRDDLARRGKLDPCTGQMLANSFAIQDANRAAVREIRSEMTWMIAKTAGHVALTLATVGVGEAAAAGVGWAQWTMRGMAVWGAAEGGYAAGHGVYRVAFEHHNGGYAEMALGALEATLSIRYAPGSGHALFDARPWPKVRTVRNSGLLSARGPNWTWEHSVITQDQIVRSSGSVLLRGFGNGYVNTALRIPRSLNGWLSNDPVRRTVFYGALGSTGAGITAFGLVGGDWVFWWWTDDPNQEDR